ncbi:hypothetical protein J1605_009795 [Eschrichtius robustus]|uniref:PH domain-containing protein n=1 Tax=Eschrichtius robustus TaxID=9764 RepID=A0AB34GW51_ESCRO|nr:hypothetical protein J1605_009795 [Eschrichtius robustus]
MRGDPVAVEASVTLHQPATCRVFSRGSCTWVTGPWQWRAAQVPGKGGWQPRWFLLCGGILSYYDSPEDAWKGCKGSIQMAVCEIQVHSVDNTRMDLIIPGEQYFYLKARSVAERQRWLVALGSAKACLTDSRTQKEKGKY